MITTGFKGRAADLMARIRDIPGMLSGRLPDPTGMVRELSLALGVNALGLIKEAFVVKARGGTDAGGIKWEPLKARTIAYGRRHPGLARARAKGKARPTLSKAQDDRWRKIFAQTYRGLVAKGTSDGAAKGIAAGHAWIVLKAAGAETMLSKYGAEKVEILRDRGFLLNSLSPATPSTDRIFRINPGEVAVGSNLKYAAAHHYGNPSRGLPARPLWPDKAPVEWEDRLSETLADGIRLLIPRLLGGP